MLVAAGVALLAAIGIAVAPNPALLGLAMFIVGFAAATFGLARHSFMTTRVPIAFRARALSLIGGSHRLGRFAGPFLAAGLVALTGNPGTAIWAFSVCLVLAALLVGFAPDPERLVPAAATQAPGERPDGIAGYSNGGGAAILVAAARDGGHEDFQSIRFLMSFAGPTSPTLQAHIRSFLGSQRSRITIPTLIFGSRRDPMLANAGQMAQDLFEHCELAITDEPRPYANHALPEAAASYEPVVRFLAARA